MQYLHVLCSCISCLITFFLNSDVSTQVAKKDTQMSAPQISVTTPRKAHSRPASPTQAEASLRPTPRSLSFSPVSDKEKMQDLANQTHQVSNLIIWMILVLSCSF